MTAFKNILCPFDSSAGSQAALRYARRLATDSDARVIVLSVNDPLLVVAAEARFHNAEFGATTVDDLRKIVHKLIPDRASKLQVRYLVTAGKPGPEIVKAAKRLRSDLVVMGTRGLGGVRRLMIGSTTDYVLQHAATPVLALPAAWIAARARAGTK